MMRLIFVLALVFCVGADPFAEWVKVHKKEYQSVEELAHRRAVFETNYADMMEHNAKFDRGEVSWHRKVTPYYDLTREEWADIRLSQRNFNKTNTDFFVNQENEDFMKKMNLVTDLPDSWDWRDQGCITSIKDQGHCGSCSAFAATAIAESCFCMESNQYFDDLSEQFLVDCANGYEYHDEAGWWGNDGCDGGWTQAYLQYLINFEDGYTQEEDSYPYEGSDNNCRPTQAGWYQRAYLTGMHNTWFTNEKDMKQLVYTSPIASSIDASFLGDYDYGVYDDSRCCDQVTDSECMWDTNHDIAVVGYGHENGKDYWLIKNSWGKRFGEDGYVKIKSGTGHCGIGSLSQTAALCALQ